MIFTEFLEFVAKHHGDDFVDDLIFNANLPSEGIYTSVGTYDYSEMVELLKVYCQTTETRLPAALRQFGNYLVQAFHRKWPDIFARYDGTIMLLDRVENHIHVEVQKLYPDAQLPTFETIEISERRIVMDYSSCRALSDLALGLIEGVSDHYGESVNIVAEYRNISAPSKVRFFVELK
jgi:hypothetical protein